MPCKVCGSTDMANSHLFPRALAHEVRGSEPHMHIIDRFTPGFKPSQSGISSNDLLCKKHEAELSRADDHAIRWIRSFNQRAKPIFDGKAFEVFNSKPDMLCQFVASVIWRFSVATNYSMSGIDLGPWELKLRNGIFGPSGFQPSFFVARRRWVVDGKYHGPIGVMPYHAPAWGSRAYAFQLGDFFWGVKLDKRSHGRALFESVLRANGKSQMIVLNLGDIELANDDDLLSIFAAAEQLTMTATK